MPSMRWALALVMMLAWSARASDDLAFPVRSPQYRQQLLALRDRLRDPAPAVTAREQSECLGWMLKANKDITRTLVGHHVILLATDAFAARADQNSFVLHLDLACEVLVHLWGIDPRARAGRRFIIYPDPGKPSGHSCNGRELIIHVGVSDRDNADWFERYFHEMTHGFQFNHPAGHLMTNGFFEGWAEFMQAAVCSHLEPLGPPFAGRFSHYADHFPAASRAEYLATRLPIEEIVAYDPAAGLLMELVASTIDASGTPDWAPVRTLLQTPIRTPRWVPWHLWPARLALSCMEAFGADKARPILEKFRFPMDTPTLNAAAAQTFAQPTPGIPPSTVVSGWRHLGPFANPRGLGMEWNPVDADHLAWEWTRHDADQADQAPSPATESRCAAPLWKPVTADDRGIVRLSPDGSPAEFHYLATTLEPPMRVPLTLYVSSDDECAVYLDGQMVHLFRGNRGCTPEYPDVAYADATGTRGQIVVLVVNHGGPSAFSMSAARGGLLFEGFESSFGSSDPMVRAAAARYIASRRFQQPLARPLARAAGDGDPIVRDAVRWWPTSVRDGPASDDAEAEDAYVLGTIKGGYFGLNVGASGNQCVARHWGSDASNWLSLPLIAKVKGVHDIRIRYACPNQSSLKTRVRRGDRTIFESDTLRLPPSGKDWNAWRWFDVKTPALEPGVYHIELLEPAGSADIDIIGLAAR